MPWHKERMMPCAIPSIRDEARGPETTWFCGIFLRSQYCRAELDATPTALAPTLQVRKPRFRKAIRFIQRPPENTNSLLVWPRLLEHVNGKFQKEVLYHRIVSIEFTMSVLVHKSLKSNWVIHTCPRESSVSSNYIHTSLQQSWNVSTWRPCNILERELTKEPENIIWKRKKIALFVKITSFMFL